MLANPNTFLGLWNRFLPAKKSRVLFFWWSLFRHWRVWQRGGRKVPRYVGWVRAGISYDPEDLENMKGFDMGSIKSATPSSIPTLSPQNYPTILPKNWLGGDL